MPSIGGVRIKNGMSHSPAIFSNIYDNPAMEQVCMLVGGVWLSVGLHLVRIQWGGGGGEEF